MASGDSKHDDSSAGLTKITDQHRFLREMVPSVFDGTGSFPRWYADYNIFAKMLVDELPKGSVPDQRRTVWLLSRLGGAAHTRVRKMLMASTAYDDVVKALKSRYPDTDETTVLAELHRGQLPGETLDDYCVRFDNLISEYQRLTEETLPVSMQVASFQHGLLPHLRRHVVTANPKTLDDNMKAARLAERGAASVQRARASNVSTSGTEDISAFGGTAAATPPGPWNSRRRQQNGPPPRRSNQRSTQAYACRNYWVHNNCRGNCKYSHRPLCRKYRQGKCAFKNCRYAHLPSRFSVHPALVHLSGLQNSHSSRAKPITSQSGSTA